MLYNTRSAFSNAGTASVLVVMVVMLVTGVMSGRVLAVIRVQSRLNIRNAASPDAADFRAIVIDVVIGPRRDLIMKMHA